MKSKTLGKGLNTLLDTSNPPNDPIFEEMNTDNLNIGISKRFYAACAAMQGILANTHNYNVHIKTDEQKVFVENLIKHSYQYADELLKKENL